jgi:hypothetical protein
LVVLIHSGVVDIYFVARRLNVPNILDHSKPLLPLQAPKSLSVGPPGPVPTDKAEGTCSDINNELLDFPHLDLTSNQQIDHSYIKYPGVISYHIEYGSQTSHPASDVIVHADAVSR